MIPQAKTTLMQTKSITKISSSSNLLISSEINEQNSRASNLKNLTGEIKKLGKLKVIKKNCSKYK